MLVDTRLLKCVGAALLCFCAFFVSGCRQNAHATFEPGTIAPDFSFLVDGVERKLSDYRGKKIILHFWASWCSSCKEELGSLAKLHGKLDNKTVILAIGILEDPEVFTTFAKAQNLPFIHGSAVTKGIVSTYKITGVPESFILDENGAFTLVQEPRTGLAKVRIMGPMKWESDYQL